MSAFMKFKLRGKKIWTVKELFCLVWRSLSQHYVIKLVESMPGRLQSIIDNGGDWTTY